MLRACLKLGFHPKPESISFACPKEIDERKGPHEIQPGAFACRTVWRDRGRKTPGSHISWTSPRMSCSGFGNGELQ